MFDRFLFLYIGLMWLVVDTVVVMFFFLDRDRIFSGDLKALFVNANSILLLQCVCCLFLESDLLLMLQLPLTAFPSVVTLPLL